MTDFRTQLESLLPRLRQYALVLTKESAAADDLVQSTVLRALENAHLWIPGSDLRAWLFTIMHNFFVSDVRRKARSPVVLMSTVVERQPKLPDQESRMTLRDLDRALARLPKAQLELVLMVGLDGVPYEEAGRALGIPLGTVRSRLSRAREMLRVLMGINDRPGREASGMAA